MDKAQGFHTLIFAQMHKSGCLKMPYIQEMWTTGIVTILWMQEYLLFISISI